MRVISQLSVAVFLLAAGHVCSQQIMDGSSEPSNNLLAKQLAAALVGKTVDPFSAQFVQIIPKGADVCGLVNLKNQNGGYTGFQPFLFSQGQMFLNQTTPCR